VVEGERDGRRPFGPAAEDGAGVAAVGDDQAAADEDGHDGGGADDARGAGGGGGGGAGGGGGERAAAGRARDAAARARQRRHRVHAAEAPHQRGPPRALLLRLLRPGLGGGARTSEERGDDASRGVPRRLPATQERRSLPL